MITLKTIRMLLVSTVLTSMVSISALANYRAGSLQEGNNAQVLKTTNVVSHGQVVGTLRAGTVFSVKGVAGQWVKVETANVSGYVELKVLRRYFMPHECGRYQTWVPDHRDRCPPTDSLLKRYDRFAGDSTDLFKVCVNYADPGSRAEWDWQARNHTIPGVCYKDR